MDPTKSRSNVPGAVLNREFLRNPTRDHVIPTESFTNAPEANQFLKRKYRDPWVVPERV